MKIAGFQGDVVKLVTSSGSAVATYEYDAWGSILSKSGTMADKNPLRYRGYYYDTETGFYYLQSRYYDPANRRFINADTYVSTDASEAIASNMFAYCYNNPVVYTDADGAAPWYLIIPYWGLIHRLVQQNILLKYSNMDLSMEVQIDLPDGKRGFADICSINTGEVWEIKSCGPASAFAAGRLEKYRTGTLRANGKEVKIGEDAFENTFYYGNLEITYWTEAPGIVLYDFNIRQPKKEHATQTVPAILPAPQKAKGSCVVAPIFGVPSIGEGWKSEDTRILAYSR